MNSDLKELVYEVLDEFEGLTISQENMKKIRDGISNKINFNNEYLVKVDPSNSGSVYITISHKTSEDFDVIVCSPTPERAV